MVSTLIVALQPVQGGCTARPCWPTLFAVQHAKNIFIDRQRHGRGQSVCHVRNIQTMPVKGAADKFHIRHLISPYRPLNAPCYSVLAILRRSRTVHPVCPARRYPHAYDEIKKERRVSRHTSTDR